MRPPLEGLLLVDKPAGPTSHDIVAGVRRATGQRRVGHSGTLDPPATGLLILALGRATRLIRFLPDTPKCYEGTLALGVRTDTDDLTGRVLEQFDGPLPTLEAARAAVSGFLGRQMQVPPAVSARKVEGQRLYRLARRGTPVEAPPSAIEVFRFELSAGAAAGRLAFQADVSGGTYIRSLARDLGRRLGCGGALATLRRTSIGPFRADHAIAPPERSVRGWSPESTIPLDRIPLAPPPHAIGPDEVERFLHGGRIPAGSDSRGWVRVLGPDENLLGLGHIEDGDLAPRVVLADPPAGAPCRS